MTTIEKQVTTASTYLRSGEGDMVHLLGNLMTFKAQGTKTGNALSLTEVRTAAGAGAPPHTQEDGEAFYVLQGTYEFLVGDHTITAHSGDFVTVAPGQLHAFSNPGNSEARMLILNWPAGPHQRFFREAGDSVLPGTTEFPAPVAPDFPKIMAAAERNGIRILPR